MSAGSSPVNGIGFLCQRNSFHPIANAVKASQMAVGVSKQNLSVSLYGEQKLIPSRAVKALNDRKPVIDPDTKGIDSRIRKSSRIAA